MGIEDVTTVLTHLQWRELYNHEKPFQIFINMPEDAEDRRATNLEWEDHKHNIHDIRGSESKFSLDQNGFIFRQSKTLISNFKNKKYVEDNYLPEVEQLIKAEVDGADRVFFFDWRLRRNESQRDKNTIDLNDPTEYLHPAKHVHVDQSAAAVLNRIRLQMPEEADQLLNCRVRVINVWRPLNSVIEDWPLALCDGSTVKPSELIETDHVRRHYVGSTLYLLNSPEHKWYYLNRQRRDEVTIFKNFDSSPHVKAKYAPHASFMHDNIRIGASSRESVEVRALVFTFPESTKEET